MVVSFRYALAFVASVRGALRVFTTMLPRARFAIHRRCRKETIKLARNDHQTPLRVSIGA
ncbi:MAG TPA: hypothetical protein DCX60_07165 [Phycisphaerales bacterium]|nr:hypothetical protein [Phycisphaerales bacterium]